MRTVCQTSMIILSLVLLPPAVAPAAAGGVAFGPPGLADGGRNSISFIIALGSARCGNAGRGNANENGFSATATSRGRSGIVQLTAITCLADPDGSEDFDLDPGNSAELP